MKLFQNKKLRRNLITIFLILMLFQFVFVKPVQAGVLSVALDPITGLFTRIGDRNNGNYAENFFKNGHIWSLGRRKNKFVAEYFNCCGCISSYSNSYSCNNCFGRFSFNNHSFSSRSSFKNSSRSSYSILRSKYIAFRK